MALRKSELYSSLWKSCEELRGGMDASHYKDYVLVLLFVKYVSGTYAGDPNALIDVPAGGGVADMMVATQLGITGGCGVANARRHKAQNRVRTSVATRKSPSKTGWKSCKWGDHYRIVVTTY